MILVDTAVWIDFWKKRSHTDALVRLLEDDQVLVHDLVMAELAVGNLGPAHVREEILSGMLVLPRAPLASLDEVLTLIRTQRLDRRGLGAWTRIYLRAHVSRLPSCGLLTRRLPPLPRNVGFCSFPSPHYSRRTRLRRKLADRPSLQFSKRSGLDDFDGNPGRVPKPSRDASLPAKLAGSARVCLARNVVWLAAPHE